MICKPITFNNPLKDCFWNKKYINEPDTNCKNIYFLKKK